MRNFQVIEKLFNERNYALCLEAIVDLPKVEVSDKWNRLKGYCLQRTQKYEEALEVWNILLASNPNNAEYHAERGVCKFHLRYKSALVDFNRSVELEPDNAYRYACRAYVLDKLGDTIGAIKDYKTAIDLDPENEVNHNNLGLLEEKLGYNQDARLRFKQADLLAESHSKSSLVQEPIASQSTQKQLNKWTEVRKMLSSKQEFRRFLKDIITLFRVNK